MLILLIGCLGSKTYAQPDQIAQRFFIGVLGGGVFPKDSDIDNSLYVGGKLGYGLNEYFALGAEVGYTSWDDTEEGVDYGDVQAVPLLANLYLRYPLELGGRTFVPYLLGGIGVIFWDYEEGALLKSYGITVDMDPKLGVKAGGGFDYFLTENFALSLEGAYVWSDADMSVVAFGAYAATTIDTDFWILSGGLKYYF